MEKKKVKFIQINDLERERERERREKKLLFYAHIILKTTVYNIPAGWTERVHAFYYANYMA
jgi:hypothetical protein